MLVERTAMNDRLPWRLLWASLLGALFVLGCTKTPKTKTAQDASKDSKPAPSNTPEPVAADRSRCDRGGKKVIEVDVNHDGRADVWKIMNETTEPGTNAKVNSLSCKEVDLNFDNHMDMWVYYDDRGNVTLEEFDLDFDGRIDLWTYRQQNRLIRQELDTNFDGKADIWKFYENEKLVRIERSSQKNGRVDVWEYYEGGKLDRIGYDTKGSGQVDKWDRAPEEQPETPGTTPPKPESPPAEKKS
jgi:hypothetical protein